MTNQTASPLQKLLRSASGTGLGAKLVRGGMGSIGLKMTNKVLMLAVAVLLARIMGPENFGIYSFVLAVLAIVSVPVKMGLPTLVTRETARGQVDDAAGDIGTLWRWSTRFVLLTFAIVALLGGGLLWLSQGWLEPIKLVTFAIGLPVMLFMGLNALRAGALKGLQHVVIGQIPEMIVKPAAMIVAIAGLLLLAPSLELNPALAMGLNVLSIAFAFAVGAWLLWRYQPAGLQAGKPSRETSRYWVAAIIPLALLAGVQIMHKNVDLVMLGWLGNDRQVGIYKIVIQGWLLALFGVQAIAQVLKPYFSRFYFSNDKDRLQKLATVAALVNTSIVLAVAIVFWAFGRNIIQLVFGSDYVAAYLPLSISLFGIIIAASFGMNDGLLQMTGGERQAFVGVLIALGVLVTLDFILIPIWGMVGAALSGCCAQLVRNTLLSYQVRVRLGIDCTVLSIARPSVFTRA